MEVEAKFTLPDRKTLVRLRSLHTLAGLNLSPPRTLDVVDVYLDTPRRLLYEAGLACRQRRVEGQVLITLKELARARGAVHNREELESVVFPSALPDEWPDPLRARVLQVVGDEPLVPWFELRQTRIVRRMSQGDRTVGELSLDEACLKADGRTHTSLQVEAELRQQGTEQDLETLVACLKNEWQLLPERRSKFDWALEVLGIVPETSKRKRPTESMRSVTKAARSRWPKRPGIQPDDSMAEAARRTLQLHLHKMLSHEENVRKGQDREALHDMRVATRRMRAAVSVFDGYIDRKTIKPFAQILRRTGRVLGPVRDLDVFMEKTEQYLHTLPAERQSELDLLLKAWEKEYNTARAEMLDYLEGRDYQRLREEFAELLEKPGALERPVEEDAELFPTRVRHVLPAILTSSLARVRAYEGEMGRADVPLTRYHQLRIASKGLRYTLEFFEQMLAPEAKTSIDPIKRLQDHLGNLQDAVVTCDVLRGFLVWGTWRHDKPKRKPVKAIIAPGVALYLSVRQTEVENLIRTFHQVWSPIAEPEFRRRLLTLIAAL